MKHNPIMGGNGHFLSDAESIPYPEYDDITEAEVAAEWEEYRKIALENEA